MIASRAIVSLLLLVTPLPALSAQGKTSTPPRMTPEQRAAAQARLDAQVKQLNAAPLDAIKSQLRTAALVTRDSLAATVATASLITRAQSTKSVGVERSQARRLRGQCLATQRSSSATLQAIAAMNTPDPKGTQLLVEYRAALTEVGRRMGLCDKALDTPDKAGPASARISAAINQVNAAAEQHDRALDHLARGMEIPFR